VDVETAIRTRRSVRTFDPEHRLAGDDIARLLDLAALSPTAFNLQHWRFVVVRDPVRVSACTSSPSTNPSSPTRRCSWRPDGRWRSRVRSRARWR